MGENKCGTVCVCITTQEEGKERVDGEKNTSHPLLRIHPLRPSTLFYDAYLWAPVLFWGGKTGEEGGGGIFWSLVVADMHILGKKERVAFP